MAILARHPKNSFYW